jgi:tetratricopeptide (TPR) repeat protein
VSIAFGLSVLLLGWYDVHALVLIALVLLFLALWSAIYVLERAQIPHKMIDLKAHEWVSVLVTLGAVLLGGYGLAHTMAERYTQTINSIAVLEVDTIDDVRLRQQNPQALNPVASRHLAVIALGQVQQELAKEQYRVDLVTDGIAYAVAAANMATEQAPWDSANWLTLSTVYTQATLLSDDALRHAIDALTKAIDLKPHHPRLYVQRGNMYRAAEQYERAIDDYERAIKEDPQAIDPYLGASLAYEARGNTNAAIQVLAPLQEQLDSNIDVQFQLGRLLINRNEERDWENALFLLESVFESRPAYPGVRELLLEVYNQLGRGTDAARIRVTDS